VELPLINKILDIMYDYLCSSPLKLGSSLWRKIHVEALEKLAASSFLFKNMNAQESNLINELFDHIAATAVQQRDPEAEQLIQSKIAANPHAPYVLTQSTIILQQAVTAAQARIASLEKQVAEASSQSQGGGFLSGVTNLFGAPAQSPAPSRPVAPPPIPQQSTPAAPSTGGGFLQNAMATAAGVAGGALLFQGIENLMGHGGSAGSGGFLAGNQPTEVINNYYSDSGTGDTADTTDDAGSFLADNGDQSDFDDGFSGSGDDSFV
jgi:hypothetical protein